MFNKLSLFVTLSFSIIFVTHADIYKNDYFLEKRGSFKMPVNQQNVQSQILNRKVRHNNKVNQKLAQIKFYMINGNLEKAKLMLLQNETTDKYAKVVIFRYLAIINFIQGKYSKSLSYLNKKEMMNFSYSKNLCLMRSLNFLILDRIEESSREWSTCINSTLSLSPTDHTWMTSLINLKTNTGKESLVIPFKSVNIENEQGNFLKLFLKLSLYLGQEDKILSRLKFTNKEIYRDPEIRELIGILYYRRGDIVKAYNFIEDLQSPNSQNIKGNIFLSQKKYEPAYAQFKLALKRKVNSQNSLERVIPLAWTLSQWSDGLRFLQTLNTKTKDKYNKLLLASAFKTQQEDYKGALKDLNIILKYSNKSQSSEVNQLVAYNSLMQRNKRVVQQFGTKSCKDNDGVNCWMQFHLLLWDDFTQTIQRDEIVHAKEVDFVNRYTQSKKMKNFEEEKFIEQKDIEELDSKLISLTNNR